jgi:multicomponent K+:H+ antiporter subunit A
MSTDALATAALLAIPGLPLCGAAVLPFAARAGGRSLAWASGIVTAATLALAAWLAGPALAGGASSASLPWAPAVGLSLSLRLDGLALLFVLLILGIGLLVITYARWYLGPAERHAKFYASLLLFMAAMLGVVTADNLLLLVVFWELTSVASFLLIGFWDERPDARAGAYQSLVVTGLGGLALLAGVLVLGTAAGTFELGPLRSQPAAVRGIPAAPIALALILLGAFTKSAQAPFHFWLPSAMAAPTPVSAYLHSATMVKAGVFLLGRLLPIFGAMSLWQSVVPVVGGGTMLVGGWAALRHTDLKRLLAYSTVSQLGLLTLLYGLATPDAAAAATVHVLSHATFKAALFMTAGIVDHEVRTRDIARLGGLARHLPRTAALGCIGAAAAAGVPPLNGFVSKELALEAATHSTAGWPPWLWPLVLVAGSVLTTAYCLRFALGAFFGPEPAAYPHRAHPHEPPAGMRLPVEVLIALCIAGGIVPMLLAGPLLEAAAGAVTGAPVQLHLALWHGLTPAFGMSAAALLAGAGLYSARRGSARRALPARLGRTASELYDAAVAGVLAAARWLTDLLQNGSLRWYVTAMLGVLVAIAGAGLLGTRPAVALAAPTPPVPGSRLLTGVTIVSAAATAALWRRRWPSVLALGAVGLLLAVYFAWLSAPDLVLTQLLAESVTTILLVLVLYFLPKETIVPEPRARLARDALLALLVGGGAAGIVWSVTRRPLDSISGYHLMRSLPDAGGGNVVNVILVDFRGYDTFGEITVLAVAALGVAALVRAARRTDA